MCRPALAAAAALRLLLLGACAAVNPDVVVQHGEFVDVTTGKKVVLTGANVVMKGPPWIPAVEGQVKCGITAVGEAGCKTFNAADAANLKALGYNLVRLGVIWAGGQPTAAPELDPAFVARLKAFLALAHEHGGTPPFPA